MVCWCPDISIGFRGDSLIVGSVTANATRTTATEIESYIESRITTDG